MREMIGIYLLHAKNPEVSQTRASKKSLIPTSIETFISGSRVTTPVLIISL